jgi:hypothetical protein
MANEPCAYYKTALPLWLCEFIVGARRSNAHSRGPSAALPRAPAAPAACSWSRRPITHATPTRLCVTLRVCLPFAHHALWSLLLGVVLLSIGLFWVFRQCRHPRIRAKERWWSVEAAMGSTVFVFLLYNGPGFWYSRRVGTGHMWVRPRASCPLTPVLPRAPCPPAVRSWPRWCSCAGRWASWE